jgi:hypothetical protein
MGEKFQVSPATGAGGMTVPLALAPGRPGGTPELALRYDSGHGNGICGLGWQLGVISIARRTDKRLPRYTEDGPDADVFVLAGAEDLVPVLLADLSGIDERSVTEAGRAYRVRRYRPRVEEGFARIERWTAPDGVAHWRVVSRDNHTTLFGLTAAGRVADPADGRRVFEWLAERTFDDRGNVIAYEYLAEDFQGVDPAAVHEANRLGRPGGAARLLKRVRYANTTPFVADGFQLELVVDYGDHADRAGGGPPASEPDQPWPVRPDPFSSYRAGFEVRTYRRVQRLLMFHRFPELGEAPLLVRSTDLSYVDSLTGSMLRSVTEVGWSRDAAGEPVRAALAPVEFGYTVAEIDDETRTLDQVDAEHLPAGLSAGYSLVDLDGEGLAGILTDQAGGWYYQRNLGSARFAPATLVVPTPVPARLTGAGQQLLDLDGDGRRSLVSVRPELPGFFDRTDDDGWARFVAFAQLPRLDWENPNLRFVDLDGDGRADVLIADEQVFTWYASAGRNGFT